MICAFEEHQWVKPAVGQRGVTLCCSCGVDELKASHENIKLEKIANKLLEIPARYEYESFDTFNVNHKLTNGDLERAKQGRAKALADTKYYADNFNEHLAAGRCLVLCGNTGNGKTHLSFAIFRQLVEAGKSVKRRTISRMFDEIKSTYSRQHSSELTSLQVMDSFVEPDLLILDEIGRQRGTEEERGLTDRILDERYEAKKCTVLVSNLLKDGIVSYIGDTRWGRIRDGGGIMVVFDWGDAR